MTARARLLTTAALLFATSQLLHAQNPPIYTRETAKAVVDALDDAEFAITDRNFRVTGRLHIGQAIRERGDGEFPEFEVILFCNLNYTEQMLRLNPDYVNYCPAKVTVREAGNRVVISAPLIPVTAADERLNDLVNRLNSLLREIVDYAAREWSPAVDSRGQGR